MVKKKTKSHRQTLKVKYMIEKKVKSHKKKLNKASKKNPLSGKKSNLKKDPGIPNLWPFKEQLLKKIAKSKEEEEALKANKKNAIQYQPDTEGIFDAPEMEISEADELIESSKLSNKHNSAGNYFKELKKVIDECDVVLQVLDARDPNGCRCSQVEQKILANPKKRLILVLNKIDLVPAEAADKWVRFLKREFPTIAFKSSTQHQKSNISVFGGRFNLKSDSSKDVSSISSCLGAQQLIQLLKNYCRNKDIKTSITVGVIGYPNVGKSSLINSLKRGRAVGVGATPGFTKTVQEIHLDKHIKLLDSPGVIFSNEERSDESSLALRNSLKLEKLEDPVGAAHKLVERVEKRQLLRLYQVENFESPDEFIFMVAKSKGKLKRGGIPDLEAAALSILRDWNEGKIPFYTLPPLNVDNLAKKSTVEVVDSLGDDFDIDGLEQGISDRMTEVLSAEEDTPAMESLDADGNTAYFLDMKDKVEDQMMD